MIAGLRDKSRAQTRSYEEAWGVANEVAAALAATAAERDQRGGTAKTERDLIRASGLLSISVPREFGGWGLSWRDSLRIVRLLSRVDSSLGHLFGFQHLMLATVRLYGAEWQWGQHYGETVSENLFWGNALNPLDRRAKLLGADGNYLIDGVKSFCSGASDSDRLIVSAVQDGSDKLWVAAIPSKRPGISVKDDWDNMGQRQTDSGTVEFREVAVDAREILNTPGPMGSVFASLRSCLAQLILTNIYQGIAEGALGEAKEYTRGQGRPWFTSGVGSATEDPYLLRHYGDFWVDLAGSAHLTEAAGDALDKAWNLGDDLTAEGRGECALAVALAKVAASKVGLRIANEMFEVMGARATTAKARLDRYWRNVRTHTLHDPLDYKLRDIGDWVLNERYPAPSFYS